MAAIEASLPPVTPAVELSCATLATNVEPPIDTVAVTIESAVDAITAPIEHLGAALVAVRLGALGATIEAAVDAVTLVVETTLHDVAAAVEAALDAFAAPIHSPVDAVARIGQRRARRRHQEQRPRQATKNDSRDALPFGLLHPISPRCALAVRIAERLRPGAASGFDGSNRHAHEGLRRRSQRARAASRIAARADQVRHGSSAEPVRAETSARD